MPGLLQAPSHSLSGRYLDQTRVTRVEALDRLAVTRAQLDEGPLGREFDDPVVSTVVQSSLERTHGIVGVHVAIAASGADPACRGKLSGEVTQLAGWAAEAAGERKETPRPPV